MARAILVALALLAAACSSGSDGAEVEAARATSTTAVRRTTTSEATTTSASTLETESEVVTTSTAPATTRPPTRPATTAPPTSPPTTSPGPPPPTTAPPGPQLSETARQYVRDNQRDYGRGSTARWTSFPIRVWADPNFFRPGDLQRAVDFWNTQLGSKGVSLTAHGDKGSANIVFEVGNPPPDVPPESCGGEWPDRIENNVIMHGRGIYRDEERCHPGGDSTIAIAHGIGHILGFSQHTPSGADVMGSPNAVGPSLSAAAREALLAIYSYPPGTVLA